MNGALINDKYGICNINLINADIEKIKFLYSRFQIFFPEGTDKELKANVYERLLAKQRTEGYLNSIEKLDKEYQRFYFIESGHYKKVRGYLLNFVNKYWSDYGYHRDKIFENTGWLFFFFFILNTFFFKQMSTKVYIIDKIEKWGLSRTESHWKFTWHALKYSLLYTMIIFFGIKFSLSKLRYMENLKSYRWLYLLNFIACYLIGLICMGYLLILP